LNGPGRSAYSCAAPSIAIAIAATRMAQPTALRGSRVAMRYPTQPNESAKTAW